MATFQGKRVSPEWKVVLDAAAADGVRFTLNSGQRTIAEQWALYRQNMSGGKPRPGRPLTALPSPTAPHIRVGRPDHALDVNALDGGQKRLQAWVAQHGERMAFTVPGEAWHEEIVGGPAALKRLVAKLRRATPNEIEFTKNEARTVYLLTEIRKRPSTPERRSQIRKLKRTIRVYRSKIRAAAALTGWDKADRKRRYEELGKVYGPPARTRTTESVVPVVGTSQKGLELIAKSEGFRSAPYQDVAKVWTIGYGHTAGVTARTPIITQPQGLKLLAEDVRKFESGVKRLVNVPLTQGQFDALVSFSFNVGLGALGSSTLLKKLNAGDKAGAAAEFPRWNKSAGKEWPGLTTRRAAEKALFLS